TAPFLYFFDRSPVFSLTVFSLLFFLFFFPFLSCSSLSLLFPFTSLFRSSDSMTCLILLCLNHHLICYVVSILFFLISKTHRIATDCKRRRWKVCCLGILSGAWAQPHSK